MKKLLAILLSMLMLIAVIPIGLHISNAETILDQNIDGSKDVNTKTAERELKSNPDDDYEEEEEYVEAWPASGQCGEDLYWTFNKSTGALTVTGSGAMWEYDTGSGECIGCEWDRYDKTLIKSVSLPEGMTNIGMNAFGNCTNLKSITIPDSVTDISEDAFYNCKKLATIHIGSGITRIYDYSFSDTAWWSAQNNGLVYLDDVLLGVKGTCPSSVSIKNGTRVIAAYAFCDCTKLTSVTIPDGVTHIGDSAFGFCSNLKTINVGNGTKSVGSHAFENTGWWNAQSDGLIYLKGILLGYKGELSSAITIKSGTKVIADRALYYCQDITSVTIPKSVVTIGDAAFGFCMNLSKISVASDNSAFCSVNGTLFTKDKTELVAYPIGKPATCYSIPNYVSRIRRFAFTGYGLTSVIIPDSVTYIGERAFSCELTDIYYLGSKAKKEKITIVIVSRLDGDILYATWHYVTKPMVVVQPKSKTVAIGKTAVFSVTAAGKNLTYQWYYRTSSSGTWKASTADCGKTATYKVSATAKRNGYQYRCRIKNASGYVYTKAVTLKTGNPPSITTQPTSKTVAVGKTATFKVAASGTGLKYQWYYRTSSSGNWKASTSTSGKTATYKVTVAAKHNGYQYRCRIKNAFGYVYTKTVTLKTGN